ncbi:hypothetical protein [Caproicibacter sp. BJN0012]|uniref:hypothetical protein n=1 Tax=Caproicibacter sp. BJN0012 TaxID=3110227 RepID=UPI002E0FA52F
MMNERKRAALVGTVCGTGRRSMAAALPVLAAAGIEVCLAPACFEPSPAAEDLRRDLSGELPACADQWKKLGYSFDAVIFGFPETEKQAGVFSHFLNAFREKDNLVLLGSSGWNGRENRSGPAPEETKLARRFCAQAGLAILPVGDAAALLGEREHRGPWDRKTVENVLCGVCSLGAKSAVATGVWFSPDLMGSAVYDSESGNASYAFSHRIGGEWPGAGDLFGAAMIAGLLRGMHQSAAMQLAVDFTADCIRRTRESGRDGGFGLEFEACLPKLMSHLGVLKQ